MKNITSLGLVCGALLLSVASVACGGSVENAAYASPDNAGTQAVTKAPIATSGHGPMKAMSEALGQVALSTSQRTEIEQLFKDADARHVKAKADSVAPRKAMLLALASQVESGNVNRAALKPQIDASEAAWASVRTADRAAVERLHAILDPSQRAALVDAIQAKHAGGGKEGNPHGHHGHESMAKWGAELQLTPAQQEKIREDLKADHAKNGENREARKQMAKNFETFKQDKFEMSAAPTNAGRDPSGKMIHLAEIATPTLTPAQRTIAAAKLRERASHVGEAKSE